MRIPKNSRHGCKNRIELELLQIWRLIVGMSRNKDKTARSGNAPLQTNVFGALDALSNLPAAPEAKAPLIPVKTSMRGEKNTNRGRVDIIRQTAHRGGKGVTIAKNFIGISLAEKQDLVKKIQKACGVGGTVKDGCIEIQGDKRDEVKRILTEAGFKPVFAGG
ncbi:MAG: translation initiation factor [Verrucomicrobiota bacterium]